jgi:hypothetical protein
MDGIQKIIQKNLSVCQRVRLNPKPNYSPPDSIFNLAMKLRLHPEPICCCRFGLIKGHANVRGAKLVSEASAMWERDTQIFKEKNY